jgi:hypothetical protein
MLGANNGQRHAEHLRLQSELELGADRGGVKRNNHRDNNNKNNNNNNTTQRAY